jgi:hypothetical protein
LSEASSESTTALPPTSQHLLRWQCMICGGSPGSNQVWPEVTNYSLAATAPWSHGSLDQRQSPRRACI